MHVWGFVEIGTHEWLLFMYHDVLNIMCRFLQENCYAFVFVIVCKFEPKYTSHGVWELMVEGFVRLSFWGKQS